MPNPKSSGMGGVKLERLGAALQSVRERFEGAAARQTANAQIWWVECARRSLQTAHAAWQARQLDAGWGAVHDAERFLVFGLDDAELLAHAAGVRGEAVAKLRAWRGGTAATLFAALPLDE